MVLTYLRIFSWIFKLTVRRKQIQNLKTKSVRERVLQKRNDEKPDWKIDVEDAECEMQIDSLQSRTPASDFWGSYDIVILNSAESEGQMKMGIQNAARLGQTPLEYISNVSAFQTSLPLYLAKCFSATLVTTRQLHMRWQFRHTISKIIMAAPPKPVLPTGYLFSARLRAIALWKRNKYLLHNLSAGRNFFAFL